MSHRRRCRSLNAPMLSNHPKLSIFAHRFVSLNSKFSGQVRPNCSKGHRRELEWWRYGWALGSRLKEVEWTGDAGRQPNREEKSGDVRGREKEVEREDKGEGGKEKGGKRQETVFVIKGAIRGAAWKKVSLLVSQSGTARCPECTSNHRFPRVLATWSCSIATYLSLCPLLLLPTWSIHRSSRFTPPTTRSNAILLPVRRSSAIVHLQSIA